MITQADIFLQFCEKSLAMDLAPKACEKDELTTPLRDDLMSDEREGKSAPQYGDIVNGKRWFPDSFPGIYIPRDILEEPDLSTDARVLWSRIHFLNDPSSGGCYAGNDQLAAILGLKRSQLYEKLAELRRHGLLEEGKEGNYRRVLRAISPQERDSKVRDLEAVRNSGLNVQSGNPDKTVRNPGLDRPEFRTTHIEYKRESKKETKSDARASHSPKESCGSSSISDFGTHPSSQELKSEPDYNLIATIDQNGPKLNAAASKTEEQANRRKRNKSSPSPVSESEKPMERAPFVFINEIKHQALIAKHGEVTIQQAYLFLSEWKESKMEVDPKAANAHTDYHRINRWVIKEVKAQRIGVKSGFKRKNHCSSDDTYVQQPQKNKSRDELYKESAEKIPLQEAEHMRDVGAVSQEWFDNYFAAFKKYVEKIA